VVKFGKVVLFRLLIKNELVRLKPSDKRTQKPISEERIGSVEAN